MSRKSRKNPSAPAPLLVVNGLDVRFAHKPGARSTGKRAIRAVSDVSFSVGRGETLGLVGESGCGKTTTGRAVLRLVHASAGSVTFDDVDVLRARGASLRRLRRRMQIVFQDPAGSLNGRMRVGAMLEEPLQVHGLCKTRADRRARVGQLLERCGMPPSAADRYPHEFSGGQRQRIAIARAIALEPDFIVCDEPTSALDVSVQAQILNLLKDLQRDLGMSYLFISHDMAVIDHMCGRVAVMLKGEIVESGDRAQIMSAPAHPYTRKLLDAAPGIDDWKKPRAEHVASSASSPPAATP